MKNPLRASLAVFAALVLGGSSRFVPEPGARLVLAEGATPAIDNGLDAAQVRGPGVSPELAAPRAGPAPYVPGRVIVKFRDPSALASIASGSAVRSAERPSWANFDVLTIDPEADPEEFARALAARPDVEYAQAAYTASFYFVPNDPFYSVQWSLRALEMERAWDVNPGASRSIVVAVLDSGIAFENVVLRYNTLPINVIFLPEGRVVTINHGVLDVPYAAAPDLIAPDRIVAPFDFTFNDRHPVDTLGHGTHVAGTIGQLTNNAAGVAGMAFNVRLMPVKVAAGSIWDFIFRAPSPNFSDDQVARSIRYAADNGAKVLNMSFGRSAGGPAPVVEDALRYAVSRGAVCVFAAGNGALAGSPFEQYAGLAPRIEGVLAVGAVGPDLSRARYSSRGSWVELAAPGGDSFLAGTGGAVLQQSVDPLFFANILQPPRFDAFSLQNFQGTSMAAPHVSGFAALLMQQGVTDPAAVEDLMKRYATDLGPAGRDDEYGAGLINPRVTLRGLGIAK